MQFEIYLRDIIIPSEQIDSRYVGYGQTTSFCTTLGVSFSSGIAGQSVTWVGGLILFTSGNFAGISATIAGEIKTGTTLDAVLFSEVFPVAPSNGSTFILYRKGTGTIGYGNTIYQIGKYTESITFETSITGGYSSAQINVNQKFPSLLNKFSSLLGMDVQIEDMRGKKCFQGIISSVDFGNSGGTINCIGYYQTFNWYKYSKIYNNSVSNTSVKLLKDICAENPYILGNSAIDRNSAWGTAQQAIGGIGPINFSESEVTMQEAINRILEMGYYGISIDPVYMMIYDGGFPIIKNIPEEISNYDYFINRNNYSYSNAGFGIKGDLTDTYSLSNTTYTDGDNNTFYTPYATNIRLLNRFGLRKTLITSINGGGIAQSMAAVQVANRDFKNLISSDAYELSGYVYKNGMSAKVPSYYIRAGDMVKIETPYGYENIYKNATMDVTSFCVGSTSYDSSTDIMKINPLNNPKKSEIFSARLKV